MSAILPISASERSRHVSNDCVITVTEDEVQKTLKHVNVRKDGISGHTLRSCADHEPSCLNDYRPVVMKVFERLIINIICSSIPGQFSYCLN